MPIYFNNIDLDIKSKNKLEEEIKTRETNYNELKAEIDKNKTKVVLFQPQIIDCTNDEAYANPEWITEEAILTFESVYMNNIDMLIAFAGYGYQKPLHVGYWRGACSAESIEQNSEYQKNNVVANDDLIGINFTFEAYQNISIDTEKKYLDTIQGTRHIYLNWDITQHKLVYFANVPYSLDMGDLRTLKTEKKDSIVSSINSIERIKTISETDYNELVKNNTVDDEVEYHITTEDMVPATDSEFKAFFDAIYPVGCLFQTTNADFNIETAFGGKWEKVENSNIVISESINVIVYRRIS